MERLAKFLDGSNLDFEYQSLITWGNEKPMWASPRLLRIAAIASVLSFLFSLPLASPTSAQTSHHVRVGGQVTGASFTNGVVWFNGYDPGTIVIHPGDSVVWDTAGGVHTVTSTDETSNGSFVFDSSPLFTPAGALADIGPRKLLGPGSVFSLDTSSLPLGSYPYFCKIHPGMRGNLTVTTGPVMSPIVTAIAGFGDSVFAHQAFAPTNLSIPQGMIVRWTLLNPTEPHTITGTDSTGSIAWDSSPDFNPPGPPPVMLPGNSFTVTFSNPGTFTYFCKVHAYKVGGSWVGMVGIVQVVEPTPTGTINDLTAASYASLGLAGLALAVAIYSVVRRK